MGDRIVVPPVIADLVLGTFMAAYLGPDHRECGSKYMVAYPDQSYHLSIDFSLSLVAAPEVVVQT
ncbi:hypothetical protein OQY15_02765 [Pedobacter sp. MC2016-15]|uniref:hypothetical protein n=1 Tax=Pedobacter sp. MC2016-15 TaxID=2994473 RepID=UPI0022457FB1|nr:hypothetical protein [Pedobacter sp. MC2016-15]MCX2477995.1 hypothetical protein [Pedobacter sp. MC2016-15]